MGIKEFFGMKEDEEDGYEDDDEKKEFDIVEEVKGMTEKQLLRFLVLRSYEIEGESITNSWEELIQLAKEE